MRGQWHVNNEGEVKKCDATTKCPFEANGEHTRTKKEAMKVAEIFNEKQHNDGLSSVKHMPASERIELAKKTTDSKILLDLLKLQDSNIDAVIATLRYLDLNKEMLMQLAKNQAKAEELVYNDDIVDDIFEHDKLDGDVLRELLKIDSDDISAEVADNDKCPADLLNELSEHDCIPVRVSVARNVRTEPKTLAKLFYDKNEKVRAAAEQNPMLPMKLMLERATRDAED